MKKIAIFVFILLSLLFLKPVIKNNGRDILYGNAIVNEDVIENFNGYNPSNYTDMYFYNLRDNYGYNSHGS